MELHHIVEKAAEGEDTFDNAIPLCFDCHSDMRSYDHKHPKGTKYTSAELRRHRDRWYQRVQNSPGPVLSQDGSDPVDMEVYERLIELLPWDGSIDFLRNVGASSGLFDDRQLDDLRNFSFECDDPTFEFLDTDLEGMRAQLASCIESYLNKKAVVTFPKVLQDQRLLVGIPSEWHHKQPERYRTAVDELNSLEIEITEQYDRLLKAAVRKLGATRQKRKSKSEE